MRGVVSLGVAACLVFSATLPAHSQSNQLLQGTQIRLVLLNGLSTPVARDGDPFAAVVVEPVYMGGQLMLPAGTRVQGQITSVIRPRHFSMFRGQAAMNLTFRSIEVDRREIPVQMSILAIQDASTQNSGRKRKDLKVEEGQVVEVRPEGDATAVGWSTNGGTVVGAVFGHVGRGLALGLIGGMVYMMVKKGKPVELPAQTALLVRLDKNVTLPTTTAHSEPYISNPR